jgi:hypothetical protein
VRRPSWLAVCVQTRGERRGGCACVFAESPGAKPSFHVSFSSGDCGEDGCGELPFVGGYGALRSLAPVAMLWREGRVGPFSLPLGQSHSQASNPSRRPLEEAKGRSKDDSALPDRGGSDLLYPSPDTNRPTSSAAAAAAASPSTPNPSAPA